MKISFTYPNLPHPNSKDLTILELARVLEKKYKITEVFVEHIKEKFKKRIVTMLNRSLKIREVELQEWLKNEWRDYIISGKAGFTIASQKRGDPAFVDTGAYYLSMRPEFKFDKKEKEFIK